MRPGTPVRWQEETAAGTVRSGTIAGEWAGMLLVAFATDPHRGRVRVLLAILPRERLEEK